MSEPIVVRHWRQEWRYEAEQLLAYEGANTWALRDVPARDRRGAWVQSVYQVDDSPRYAARGRWQHSDSIPPGSATRPGGRCRGASSACARTTTSSSAPTATRSRRPAGCRRRTTSSSRWRRQARDYLAREYGVARYERISDYDFSAGEDTSRAPSRSGPKCAPPGANSPPHASRCARSPTRRSSSCRSSSTPRSWRTARPSIATRRAPSSSAPCRIATSHLTLGVRS